MAKQWTDRAPGPLTQPPARVTYSVQLPPATPCTSTPAAFAAMVEVAGMVERVRDVTAVLAVSVSSGDCLTARYAAASLSELSDRIETALLAIDREAKAPRLPVAR